ncbi:hypothetical protein D3C71_1886050 [compost metagenome]
MFDYRPVIQPECDGRDISGVLKHAEHLRAAFPGSGDQRKHGDAKPPLKGFGIDDNASGFGDINHI